MMNRDHRSGGPTSPTFRWQLIAGIALTLVGVLVGARIAVTPNGAGSDPAARGARVGTTRADVGRRAVHRARTEVQPTDGVSTLREERSSTVRIAGIVVDADGRIADHDGVHLLIVTEGPQESSQSIEHPCDEGRFRLDLHLGAETASVRVRAVDGASRRLSAPAAIEVARGSSGSPLVLRLNETILVNGRIVRRDGTPLAGARVRVVAKARESIESAAHETEAFDDPTTALADEHGRFAVAARDRPGWVEASAGGPFGERVDYDPCGSSRVDVGDVHAPVSSEDVVRLSVIVRDAVDSPCEGALVVLDPTYWPSVESLPAYSCEVPALRADARGRLDFELPVRQAVTVLGIGSPRGRTRAVAVDLSAPGERCIEIELRPRIRRRFRLVGPDVAAFVSAATRYTVRRKDGADPSDFEIDREGAPLVETHAGSIQRVVGMPSMLEFEFHRRESEGTTTAEFDLTVWREGDYVLGFECEGSTVLEHAVRIEDSVAESPIEVHVPAGRSVALDLREVADWLRRPGATATFGSLAVWPCAAPRGDAEPIDSNRVLRPLLWLSPDRLRTGSHARIWCPASSDCVAVGIVEQSSDGMLVASNETDVTHLAVSSDPERTVTVPAPGDTAGRTSRITFQIENDGRRLDAEGLSVTVGRIDEATGGAAGSRVTFSRIRMGSGGSAAMELRPGRYVAYVDPRFGGTDRTQFDVTTMEPLAIALQARFAAR